MYFVFVSKLMMLVFMSYFLPHFKTMGAMNKHSGREYALPWTT